ncbi:alpha/beta fold hydrolase [Flavobacterium sp. NKUCC04_CG]|uniref:alpha/beta fold hydrolase n=1 Tax=Flavobacterium sp. NKUCC04_CG TaxID=2842121 RepID=UPI001C5B0FCE|nr:alpha/beta fold hydrolase [Flavobacterium sp. NKUCC04_CG]MBW3518199.1 alpha/beta fold hydrolase [Flavobacterium sp. NKUCC04_CG]
MIFSKIEGTGIPFIIIHGYLGMSDNWKSFGTHLAEKGYEVHLLDMRNHGRSFHSEEFSYALMVADVEDYFVANKLSQSIVLGHSMGGKVAMSFAVKNPQLVSKLLVVDIGPKYYPPHHQDILEALNAVDFSLKPSRSEVESVLTPLIPDASTRMFLMKNLYWREPGQLDFRFNLKAFNKQPEAVGEALAAAAVFEGDVLFIKGARSSYILEQDQSLIKQHFPKAITVQVPDAGHWVHAENPLKFQEVVEQFL